MTIFRKIFIVLVLFFTQSTYVNAVNWLMIQGTEPAKVKHKPFLFLQAGYTSDLSDEISLGPNSGKRVLSTTIAPWFEDESRFHLRRFRVGIKGNFTGVMRNSFTEKMNYFFLTELAPNLMTYEFLGERERAVALDHFSLTFNHLKGARFRLGLFKTPGLEETYQGIVAQDYIEFTDFAARQVLERFATGNIRVSPSGGINAPIGTPVTQGSGINAARDWGVQVFDSFKNTDWDYSYAFMLGRGAAIQETTRTQAPLEQYYYLSAEKSLPGGRGPWKHGVKYYAWLQQGARVFESDPLQQEFDRLRYGAGIRAQGALFGLKAKQRLDIALNFADGMIFISPRGGVKGGGLMYAAQEGNKTRALSIDYGHFITKHWELMIRLEQHDLLYETDGTVWTSGDQRDISAITYGIQYVFTPKLKLAFNYIDRKIEAPNESNPVVEDVIGSVGARYALQLTWIY